MSTTPGQERVTMTVREAARALGIGERSAYAAVREGIIPSIAIGRRLLIPRDAFEGWLAGEVHLGQRSGTAATAFGRRDRFGSEGVSS